jgi:predicted molibdopterin-dependent oxidoreductase YjgC
MGRTPTVCPFCGCGCSFYLVSQNERVAGIEPSIGNPVNKGMLCVKGWNAYEFIHSPDRLTAPLIRKHGALVESTWDEALKTVSERLTDIKSRYGPRAMAFLSSAKVTNEENYLFMKMARAAFGTNNVDHCARL